MSARKHPMARSAVSLNRQSGGISRSGARGRTETTVEVVRSTKAVTNATKGRKTRKPVLRFGRIPENPEFRAFIRTFPCVLEGKIVYAPLGNRQMRHVCSGRIEASHVGRSAMKLKAADETCLPMCVNGHRTGWGAFHKTSRLFLDVWGLNKKALVEKYQALAREAGIHVAEGVVV